MPREAHSCSLRGRPRARSRTCSSSTLAAACPGTRHRSPLAGSERRVGTEQDRKRSTARAPVELARFTVIGRRNPDAGPHGRTAPPHSTLPARLTEPSAHACVQDSNGRKFVDIPIRLPHELLTNLLEADPGLGDHTLQDPGSAAETRPGCCVCRPRPIDSNCPQPRPKSDREQSDAKHCVWVLSHVPATGRCVQVAEVATACFRSGRSALVTADRCLSAERRASPAAPARRRRLPSRQLHGAPAHTGVRPPRRHSDRHVLGRNAGVQRADHDRWIREHHLVKNSPRGVRNFEICSLPLRVSRSLHHGRPPLGSQRLPERLQGRTMAGRTTGPQGLGPRGLAAPSAASRS